MSREQTGYYADAPGAVADAGASGETKEELERRMGEARDSITQTITEIKETVTGKYEDVKHKYEDVRQGVADTFDWREQYRRHPVEWSLAAVALGLLAGFKIAEALQESEAFGRFNKEVASAADRLADLASEVGDGLVAQLSDAKGYIVPAVAGAGVPLLAGKLKELLGLDLDDLLAAIGVRGAGGKKRKGKKKAGQKKKGKRKNKARRPDVS